METPLFKTKYKAWHIKEKQWHYFTFSDLITGRAVEEGTALWYEQWQQISHFPSKKEDFSATDAHPTLKIK